MMATDICKVYAQGEDPVLAGMIMLYTDKAKDELKQQEQMMLLESTGHIWIKEEVESTYKLQREFNNYLDQFHSIITYAAQTYGFYHEIDMMAQNLKSFSNQLSAHPGNALAVALSTNRNKIYREIIMNSVDIVNDVRQVCLSDTKMTEKERIEKLKEYKQSVITEAVTKGLDKSALMKDSNLSWIIGKVPFLTVIC